MVGHVPGQRAGFHGMQYNGPRCSSANAADNGAPGRTAERWGTRMR